MIEKEKYWHRRECCYTTAKITQIYEATAVDLSAPIATSGTVVCNLGCSSARSDQVHRGYVVPFRLASSFTAFKQLKGDPSPGRAAATELAH